MDSGTPWAVVLASGDATRLRARTVSTGVTASQQYVSPWDHASQLDHALLHGAAVAPLRRTRTVVAAPHRRWWSTALAHLPDENVIVQPQNRGTGIGILLALLHILDRDPDATVILIPANHYTQDADAMAAALRQAAELAAADAGAVYLLGAEAAGPDPEFGYILPTDQTLARYSSVLRFVEKPTLTEAAALLAQGALLNMFILAGSVGGLLRMYRKSHDDSVSAMERALEPGSRRLPDRALLSDLYEHLEPIDFSHDVLVGQEQLLRVVPVARGAGAASS